MHTCGFRCVWHFLYCISNSLVIIKWRCTSLSCYNRSNAKCQNVTMQMCVCWHQTSGQWRQQCGGQRGRWGAEREAQESRERPATAQAIAASFTSSAAAHLVQGHISRCAIRHFCVVNYGCDSTVWSLSNILKYMYMYSHMKYTWLNFTCGCFQHARHDCTIYLPLATFNHCCRLQASACVNDAVSLTKISTWRCTSAKKALKRQC